MEDWQGGAEHIWMSGREMQGENKAVKSTKNAGFDSNQEALWKGDRWGEPCGCLEGEDQRETFMVAKCGS